MGWGRVRGPFKLKHGLWSVAFLNVLNKHCTVFCRNFKGTLWRVHGPRSGTFEIKQLKKLLDRPWVDQQQLFVLNFFVSNFNCLWKIKVLSRFIQKIPLIPHTSEDGLYLRKKTSFPTNRPPKNSGTIHFRVRRRFVSQKKGQLSQYFGRFFSNKHAPTNISEEEKIFTFYKFGEEWAQSHIWGKVSNYSMARILSQIWGKPFF